MKDILRPILELLVVLPGLLLGYFPVKTYLKQSPGRLAAWLFPLMACLCIGSGLACYRLGASTFLSLAGVALAAICLYTRTLTISLWKSGTIALSVCAVFACVNSLSRAVSAAIIRNLQLPPDGPWLCLGACVFYNAVCWVIVLAAYYPATHTVRAMVEDDNFAQTWYVFWFLPLAFILLNLFMIPRYQSTLQTGRVLQGYIVLSSALLVFMFCFNAVFLLMATSLNRNAKLQQENQFLSMQQQRYENLRTAIEEARQARHDMRHQLNQISALAEAGDLEDLKSYLAKTVSRIPNLDMCFCENRAADSVVGYYCAMAKRDEIPFRARLDLPETLPVDEIDMCLVLSNLLENALEASLRTAPGRRQIEITACVHADRILLIEVENAFDGEVNEKNGVFRSSKRRENGIGIQSVTHIAEKTGGTSTFTHQNGTFSAKVMLCGYEDILTAPGATTRRGPGGCPLLLRKERSNTMEQLLRQRAEAIWTAAIRAVLPDEAVRRALEHFHPQGRVFLVAAGKAAWQMAHAALAVLGCVDGGIVITKYGHVRGPLPGVTCCEAGHPVPDDNSFAATQRALALVSGLRADDTVLFLLSGGGSALFEKPLLPAEELQAITQALLACGADIVEINTIRKRLSAVKGGRFALACAPAAVYSVVLSDILGDPLDMIASGPACPDSSTCAQAAAIAEKYRLALSPAAAALLRQETPKTLPNVTTKITGSVRELCRAAADACRAEGYEPILLTDCLCCEAREAGSLLGSIARTHAGQGRKRAFIAGGETVVHLTGHGLGGRNQELALAAAPALAGLRGCCVFSVGSDGTDGPTDAAGGYTDGEALAALTAAGLNVPHVLADNDAYHALQAVGGLIMTGPTGTNVNDVAVVLAE